MIRFAKLFSATTIALLGALAISSAPARAQPVITWDTQANTTLEQIQATQSLIYSLDTATRDLTSQIMTATGYAGSFSQAVGLLQNNLWTDQLGPIVNSITGNRALGFLDNLYQPLQTIGQVANTYSTIKNTYDSLFKNFEPQNLLDPSQTDRYLRALYYGQGLVGDITGTAKQDSEQIRWTDAQNKLVMAQREGLISMGQYPNQLASIDMVRQSAGNSSNIREDTLVTTQAVLLAVERLAGIEKLLANLVVSQTAPIMSTSTGIAAQAPPLGSFQQPQ